MKDRESTGAAGIRFERIALAVLEVVGHHRHAAWAVATVLAGAQGAGELDERLTDLRIAQALGRSTSFVQQGLKALERHGIVSRTRGAGRRQIRFHAPEAKGPGGRT